MAVPTSIEARLFYRCAFQRHDDAQILLRADHTTGAVYLAGYGVECILKALVLADWARWSATRPYSGYGVECILKALVLADLAPAARTAMLDSFRGARAHDYEWLRTQYLQNGGARFPREITKAFTLVNDWSTDLRYLPRTSRTEEAVGSLSAAERIIRWVDGRL